MRKKISYYVRERHRGRIFSVLLHMVLLLFVIFGLPSFLTPTPPEEPHAISVEILPISEMSNVKPAEAPPEPEQKPEEKHAEQKKPSPPVKTAQEAPPPPPKEAVPLPDKPKEKKEEKKPEPPKEKKEEKKPEKKKPKQDDLMAVLKAVKETAQKEKKEDKSKKPPVEDPSPTKAVSSHYDPNVKMSLSEVDAIMSQLSKCWNMPAGAKDAQDLVVVIHAEYNPDGSYIRAEIARESLARYNSDPFFRTAADAAMRAVQRCTPLTGLPADRYNGWREMDLHFDPKYALN